MASYDVLHVTCPVCNTDLLVKISYGIYPASSIETADCPVCGKEFKPTEETYCWVREGLHKYTQVCSWACFKKRIEEAPERPTANEKRQTAKKDTVKVILSKTKKMKEEENENV